MNVQVVSLKGDVVTLSDNQYKYYQHCKKLLEQNPNVKLSRELINHFGVTRQRVHQVLDKLVNYGLILHDEKRAYKHVGKRYGKFTIIRGTGNKAYTNVLYECLCDCGKVEQHPSRYFVHRQKVGRVIACRECIDAEKDSLSSSGFHHMHHIVMKHSGEKYPYLKVIIVKKGITKQKLFNISKLGVMESYAAAIKLRNEWLEQLNTGLWVK